MCLSMSRGGLYVSVLERCSSCGAARSPSDRCGYCGALYPDMISARPQNSAARSLDRKYKVTRSNNRIQIAWRWRNNGTWFLIPFLIFWNSIAFSLTSTSQIIENPWSLFPIPGIHLLVGFGGIAYVIFSLLNSTTIDVDSNNLTISHHPLPWPGHRFAVRDIDTIFVSKGRRSSKRRSWDVPILQLVTKGGRRTQLLKGTIETDFVDYESLRYKLLDALRIDPKPAYGAA